MDRIYIYEGNFEKGEKGNLLIKRAAESFCRETGSEHWNDNEIVRQEGGKPFFKNSRLKFSLSHSGLLWMCMVSTDECGLDVQIVKDCDYEKMAERYFKPSEQHYVKLWGESGFFDLWVRKEAFGKCTGEGIFSEMPSFTDENADLINHFFYKEQEYFIRGIDIADDIKCAVCSVGRIEIETRLLG